MNISPLCDVAQTSDCGMFVSYFQYKPFMWCRSDVRLWHALPLFSVISPLCGVALTPDCGIIILAVSSRGVIQTLVWHRYYYSCSFLSRSHSDPRLAPSIYFGISGGLPPDFSVISPCIITSMCERASQSVHMLHVYICYILCPNCLASTFIVLTWLVDLARCWRRRYHGWRVW